jgi:hypothetical protein
MPNITRGDRVAGLMVYLTGTGRGNVHTEPHLVAGDPAIMAWHGTDELNRDAALEIARALDHPRRAFGTEVPGGHVWHCSWSLRAEEGRIPDETWAAIAADVADGMGFSGADGKAPARWVAVHHGPSRGGNDHIHFVAQLVREDGTRASVWNDRPRAQSLARDLERKYGLQVLESRDAGRGSRGATRAELERVERFGLVEPERFTLARAVRAAATASASEAEFVRRLRRSGLHVDARFAAGRADVVRGYSVARAGGIAYGGGHLAKDLSLPRLREAGDWPDTPAAAAEAVAEWTAAKRGRPVVHPGREVVVPGPELWDAVNTEVGALRDWLRTVPVDDRATWAAVAGEVSGALAAWSTQVEPTPGPLASAADSLARSAEVRASVGRRRSGPSARGAALLCASVAHGGRGTVAQAVLLRQLSNVARAVHDAHRAAGEARRAAEIAAVARSELVAVAASLPPLERAPEAAPAAEKGAPNMPGNMPARAVGSVLPADLERARVTRTTGARDRGPER